MAKVNISQASRLVGKSRTTIHRRINKGELSIQNGLIDTSELIRAFGELVTSSEQSSTPAPRSKVVTTEHVTVQQQVQLEVLQVKYESLKRELELEREVKEGLKEQIALLEHNPQRKSENSEKGEIRARFKDSENSEYNSHDTDNTKHSINTHTPEREKLKAERKSQGRVIKLARFLFDT
jgi:hypothetical protein